jgi:hypothetical protein
LDSGCQSYEALHERLARVGCPHKLYEARLHALEVVVQQPLLPSVEEKITDRIPAAAGDPAWAEQFKKDLRTFGLLEAILYFHSYPPLSAAFLDEACELYEHLARLYLRHHDEIRHSDDPRVLAQLHLMRRLGDSREHSLPRPLEPPREPAGPIAEPQRPEMDVAYEPRLPAHADLLDVTAWLAEKPVAPRYGCFADELCEVLAAEFTFEGFPGVQAAFFGIAETLEEHEVDVFGSEGQYVLEVLAGYLEGQMFGDYEHWIPCANCGENFCVEVSLESVNASLVAGGWKCEECGGSGERER